MSLLFHDAKKYLYIECKSFHTLCFTHSQILCNSIFLGPSFMYTTLSFNHNWKLTYKTKGKHVAPNSIYWLHCFAPPPTIQKYFQAIRKFHHDPKPGSLYIPDQGIECPNPGRLPPPNVIYIKGLPRRLLRPWGFRWGCRRERRGMTGWGRGNYSRRSYFDSPTKSVTA